MEPTTEELGPIASCFWHVLEATVKSQCSDWERQKISLALRHPSPELEEVIQKVGSSVVRAFDDGETEILNRILYPEDFA